MDRIVCAANRYKRWGNKDGKMVIVLGVRHHDMLMNGALALFKRDAQIAPDDVGEQGFVNQRGEFLTREAAWLVAHAADQITSREPGDMVDGVGHLFSENYC